jgi:hypothetical protein
MDRQEHLRATYDAFNARDVDAVLEQLTEDVDWPNAFEGGRLVGHAAVREYWLRQWAVIDPSLRPLRFTARPDGRVAAEVDQIVRDTDARSCSTAACCTSSRSAPAAWRAWMSRRPRAGTEAARYWPAVAKTSSSSAPRSGTSKCSAT